MKRIILFLLTVYKKLLSPILPHSCRFYPSCSDYMSESIKKHGLIKGVAKGIYRLLRCSPLSDGGFDPV
ncbi:MAG: hypothetical protein ACD_79C00771G0003 [uncultured bacterium]|nr:MAG: hypothetical protein ACD_79C00771G0003 [uncultured bacterium]